MKLISLNVARPRLTIHKGVTINTGIFKKPVSGRVALRALNLDGDRQADLTVHGGALSPAHTHPRGVAAGVGEGLRRGGPGRDGHALVDQRHRQQP